MIGSTNKRLLTILSLSLLATSSIYSMIKEETEKKSTGCWGTCWQKTKVVAKETLVILEKIGDIEIGGVTIKATVAQLIANKLKVLDAGTILHLFEMANNKSKASTALTKTLEENGLTSQNLNGFNVLNEENLHDDFLKVIKPMIDVAHNTQSSRSNHSRDINIHINDVSHLINRGHATIVEMNK